MVLLSLRRVNLQPVHQRSTVMATIRGKNLRLGWCLVTHLQLLHNYLCPINTCNTLNIPSSRHSISNILCHRVNHQCPSIPSLSKYNNSLLLNSNGSNNRVPDPNLLFHQYQCGMVSCSQLCWPRGTVSPDQASLHLIPCLLGSDRT